ncbi:MAG TPA: CheR family methyltransferase [bacterium]|nr:CheR family methyltransferase [bacterium]
MYCQNELSDSDFLYFRSFVYNYSGICISEEKKEMLKSRIQKRLKELNLKSYVEYKKIINTHKDEITNFINAVSTNKTDFFREIKHFDFMEQSLKNKIDNMNECYIWSSACSSGEEPYSIAMILNEIRQTKKSIETKILATDIDTNVLLKAHKGVYSREQIQDIPKHFLLKNFSKEDDFYIIKDELKNIIRFKHLNLIEPFPFNKKFDFIFCRNAMIYFDTKTQQALVDKFYEMIKPGGYLFIGHSESLTRLKIKFKYVQPAIYQKI